MYVDVPSGLLYKLTPSGRLYVTIAGGVDITLGFPSDNESEKYILSERVRPSYWSGFTEHIS